MAIRKIVKDGDPILLKECRKVERFDSKLHGLLEDMKETLAEARGAGLAAPQVGILRQICIVSVDPDTEALELINPEILETEGEQEGIEGCLSFPGLFGIVKRPMKVRLRAQNRHGNWFETSGEGFTARAFCHETDHLHGVLYKSLAERMLSDEELEEMLEQENEGERQ